MNPGPEPCRRPIRLLPAEVAERIAAGEVIDRPAAAAKELIENALDAGARRIQVEARGGGLELLRVSDDGHGIPPNELDLAFARHATNKIEAFDDLQRLTTLGFRGEALPSIAAIAEVSVTSAIDGEQAGAGITLRFGQVFERGARARTLGTTVTVRDLFGNVPARRTFLKAQRIESARIGDVVRRYACGRPEVAFSLIFDGRPAFHSNGEGDVRRVLAALHGQGAVESLAPVEGHWSGGEVEGVIGTGGPWYGGRGNVCIFVNGRWVRGGAVPAAIEAAYRPFAPFRRHPVAVLRLNAPPEQIDANVHPAKLEVRLRDEETAAEAIREAIAHAFGRSPAGAGASLSLQYRLPLARHRVAEQPSGGYGKAAHQPPDLTRLRYLTTTAEGLIVAESGDGLFLVDQHRAHERVIFESLRGGHAGRDGQALLEPALLRLTELETTRMAERAADLSALGFAIEDFGSGALIARAAPAELSGLGADGLVDLLQAALDDAAGWRDRLLATAACRAAVKKGEPLEPGVARGLLDKLAATESPAVCPHGSPVVVRLAGGLLSRLFRW